MPDENYERQRKLIEGENVNISETNILKEFAQIILNIILILVCIYFLVFFISGIIIKSLSLEKQIMIENIMSKIIDGKNTKDLSKEEAERINNIKNKILKYDENFPKTSKLNVKVIESTDANALCMPNGNIYFTSKLYNKIKSSDDMLFFVIAHEMAHYKNKDHIMNLRKDIASGVILLIIAVSNNGRSDLYTIIEKTIDLSDLNYSRSVEARADIYAGKLLLKEYGNTIGGIKTLQLLSEKEYPEQLGIFSTHPTINKRISNLKKLEKIILEK